MIGEKQLTEVAGRRCQRCGRLIYLGNVDLVAAVLDQVVELRTFGFCQEASSQAAALHSPRICIVCVGIDRLHSLNAARCKTK